MRYSHKNRVNASKVRAAQTAMNPTDVCRRPIAGTPLKTITIKDHLTGEVVEMDIMQADHKNQVFTYCNGKVGRPVGWDKIMRRLRKHCVVRWLEV